MAFREWARAIGREDRELTARDYVCEKHFPIEMVRRRKYYAELGGAVVLDQPKKPKLLPGVVPCVFPKVSPGLCPAKKPRADRKITNITGESSAKRVKVDSTCSESECVVEDSNNLQTSADFQVSSVGKNVCKRGSEPSSHLRTNSPLQPSYDASTSAAADVPLQRIEACASSTVASWLQHLSSENRLPMPSHAWNYHYISVEGVECLCFVKMAKASAASTAFALKIMELAACREGYRTTKRVLGHEVSSIVGVQCETQQTKDIMDMLGAFDKQVVCHGGPAREMFPGIQLECASCDGTGFWRQQVSSTS